MYRLLTVIASHNTLDGALISGLRAHRIIEGLIGNRVDIGKHKDDLRKQQQSVSRAVQPSPEEFTSSMKKVSLLTGGACLV